MFSGAIEKIITFEVFCKIFLKQLDSWSFHFAQILPRFSQYVHENLSILMELKSKKVLLGINLKSENQFKNLLKKFGLSPSRALYPGRFSSKPVARTAMVARRSALLRF